MQDTVGEDILHTFVETTSEFQKETDDAKKDKLKDESFNKWTTYLFLSNSDQKKYGSLMKTFRTQYSLGQNQYCKSITRAGDVLTNNSWDASYKENIKKKKQQRQEKKEKENKDEEEKQFAQTKAKKDPTCFCCGGNHYASKCDKKDSIPKDEWAVRKGLQMFNKDADNKDESSDEDNNDNDKEDTKSRQIVKWDGKGKKKGYQGFQMNLIQDRKDDLDFNWSVILDTGSTFTSIKNKDLVINMEEADEPIQMRTNTGGRKLNKQGEVIGLETRAWIDEQSVANIFGFSDIVDQYHVTFDNSKDDAFHVHIGDRIVKFKRSEEGLYYYNFTDDYKEEVTNQNNKITGVQMVSTVAENCGNYTTQQFEKAKEARKLYHNIGSTTVENFKYMLKSNGIRNCPVTIEDVKIAEDIWGNNISYLKGKTTRNRPPVVKSDLIEISKELKAKGYSVTLCIDTMYINKIGFLTSIGYPMYYRKCSYVEDNTTDEFYRKIDKAVRIYNNGGFRVNLIECDGEYKSMMDKVSDDMDITMNYTNAQDHS